MLAPTHPRSQGAMDKKFPFVISSELKWKHKCFITILLLLLLNFLCQTLITIDLTTLRNGADKYVLESRCVPVTIELTGTACL